jgi:hypothetical protein
MLQGGAAERPQRILQPLGKGDEALAAEHDLGMLPAGEGQAEVIQTMIERHAGDADVAITHAGKVGQTKPARRMLLPEDHILLGTVERPPGSDTPLQRTADTGADLRVAATDLVENGNRPQPRDTLKQGHHLAIPDRGQRVSSPPAPRRFLLRRQPGVLFDAIGGGDAEPGLGRGNDRRLGLAQTHE